MATLEQLQFLASITSLYPWEEQLALTVGTGRTTENKGKGDRVSYDASRLMESNLLANIHAAVVEIGCSRIIGAYCFAAVWEKNNHDKYAQALPDALCKTTEIEIKWRRTAMSMPVDFKDAEANRLVLWAESKLATHYNCTCSPLCEAESGNRATSKVRLLGGGFAGELWSRGKPYNNDQNRVAIHFSHITPIADLEF